jgi:hypothetical protein
MHTCNPSMFAALTLPSPNPTPPGPVCTEVPPPPLLFILSAPVPTALACSPTACTPHAAQTSTPPDTPVYHVGTCAMTYRHDPANNKRYPVNDLHSILTLGQAPLHEAAIPQHQAGHACRLDTSPVDSTIEKVKYTGYRDRGFKQTKLDVSTWLMAFSH